MPIRVHNTVPDPQTGYILNEQRSFFSVIVPEETVNLVLDPEMRAAATTAPAVAAATSGYARLVGATATLQSARQRRGLKAYMVIATALGDGICYKFPSSLVAGNTYSFSLDLQGIGEYRIFFADASGNRVGAYKRVSGYTFWDRVTMSAYLASAVVQSICIVATKASTFYVDGFQCEKKDHSTTFTAGGMGEGYSWLGTQHRSMSHRKADTVTGGRVVPLSELGFDVMSIASLGFYDSTNSFSDYALRGGGYFQGSRTSVRAFSLVGNLSSDSFYNLLCKRNKLGGRLTGRARDGSDPIVIVAQLFDCGAPVSETATILAYYKSGLSGNWDNLYQEKVSIIFEAPDPLLQAESESANVLALQQTVTSTSGAVAIGSDGVAYDMPGFTCNSSTKSSSLIGPDGNLYASCGKELWQWNGFAWTLVYTDTVSDILCMVVGQDAKLYIGRSDPFNGKCVVSISFVDGTIGTLDGLTFGALPARLGEGIQVNAIRVEKYGRLAIAGRFDTVYDTTSPVAINANNVVLYEFATNSLLGLGTGLGDGISTGQSVKDMVIDSTNAIWVVGAFTSGTAAPVGITHFASYGIDGSTSWTNGGAFYSSTTQTAASAAAATVTALGYDRARGIIYVGGTFLSYQSVNGVVVSNLKNAAAVFPKNLRSFGNSSGGVSTPGAYGVTTVEPLSGGVGSTVNGFAVACNGTVAVTGLFSQVYAGTTTLRRTGVAFWDGRNEAWTTQAVNLVAASGALPFAAYGGDCGGANSQNSVFGLGPLAFNALQDTAPETTPSDANSFFVYTGANSQILSTAVNTVTVCGNSTGCTIEITGEGTLEFIRNARTGQAIRLLDNGGAANGLYIADGELVTIRLGLGRGSIISTTRGDLTGHADPSSSFPNLELMPGDNQIVVRVVSPGTNASAYVRWRTLFASMDSLCNGGCI